MQITGSTAAFSNVRQPAILPASGGNRVSTSAPNPDNLEQPQDSNTTTQTQTIASASVVQVQETNVLTNGEDLTPEEEKVVQELKQRDAEMRAHEQAHKNIAGPYAGAISYQTVTGPDGRQYAVGGSVKIDASPIPNNPQATIRKMEVVIRAALAPAEPSPEDQAVARTAQNTRQQAQRELTEQREEEQAERRGENSNLQGAIEAYERANELSQTSENPRSTSVEAAEFANKLIDSLL